MRLSLLLSSLVLLSAASPAAAQNPTVAWQIAAAVLPLPDSMRAGAEVLGYKTAGGPLVQLRAGTNPMICLADDPTDDRFAAHCYHKSLEAFMRRGRELRAAGITKRSAVDSARLAEVNAGTITMPAGGAALYSLYADSLNFDPMAGRPKQSSMLVSFYLPYATQESTGISVMPLTDQPWLMYPGKPWAHLMIQ
ncbi:MAG TPA: hypothetical protein PKA66_05215 [Gemmatimonadales bacterium]|nr:hypothetical protein [Gemmatimonadales bacterium]